MTSRWLQAQLTLVINLLTLKTVDISSRFSPLFYHTNENIECFREYFAVGYRAPDPSFF